MQKAGKARKAPKTDFESIPKVILISTTANICAFNSRLFQLKTQYLTPMLTSTACKDTEGVPELITCLDVGCIKGSRGAQGGLGDVCRFATLQPWHAYSNQTLCLLVSIHVCRPRPLCSSVSWRWICTGHLRTLQQCWPSGERCIIIILEVVISCGGIKVQA